MLDDEDYEAQRKPIRNGIGFLLVAVWIIWWWHAISSAEQAALAALPSSASMLSAGKNYIESGSIEWSAGMKKFIAVLSSPLMFIPAQYLSRLYIGQQKNSARSRATAAQKARKAEQSHNIAQMREAAASEASTVQQSNDRHEFVGRIGDVDSQLLIFESEQDQERKTRMLLNLTQYIYEIHAKYPSDRLRSIVGKDPSLAKMIRNTLAHMQRLGLHERNFYTVMEEFLPPQAEGVAGNGSQGSFA